MGKKSRHIRNESDPLLGIYSSQIAATSSVRPYGNPLHATTGNTPPPTPSSARNHYELYSGDCDVEIGGGYDSIQPQDSTDSSDYDPPSPPRKQASSLRSESYNSGRSIRSLPRKTKPGYRVHRVSYTAQNHVQVLFRMYGSAFPQVLPFCVANFIWATVVILLKNNAVVDLTFHSSIGHSFTGLCVSSCSLS